MTTATLPITGLGLLGQVSVSVSGKPKKVTKAQQKKRTVERMENLSRPLVGMTDVENILRYLELVESEFIGTLAEFANLITPKELEAIGDKRAYKTLIEKFSVIEEMAGPEKHDQIVSVVHSMEAMSGWASTQVRNAQDSDHVVSPSKAIAHNEAFASHLRALLGLVAVISMINDDEPSWPTDSLMHLIDALDDLMDDAEVSLLGTQPANYDLKESEPLSVLADVL